MNGAEQQARKTAIERIRAELKKLEDDCALVIEEGLKRCVAETKTRCDATDILVKVKAEEIELHLKTFTKCVEEDYDNLETFFMKKTEPLRRGFWGRFKWLLFAR